MLGRAGEPAASADRSRDLASCFRSSAKELLHALRRPGAFERIVDSVLGKAPRAVARNSCASPSCLFTGLISPGRPGTQQCSLTTSLNWSWCSAAKYSQTVLRTSLPTAVPSHCPKPYRMVQWRSTGWLPCWDAASTSPQDRDDRPTVSYDQGWISVAMSDGHVVTSEAVV